MKPNKRDDGVFFGEKDREKRRVTGCSCFGEEAEGRGDDATTTSTCMEE